MVKKEGSYLMSGKDFIFHSTSVGWFWHKEKSIAPTTTRDINEGLYRRMAPKELVEWG